MTDSNFVVKNGLVVNGAFTANSTTVNAAAINATSYAVGTAFTANATLVNAYALTIQTTTSQLGNLTISNSAVILANGSFGAANTVLTSNGTGMYWATPASSNNVTVRQQFTANGTQNTFTVSGGYNSNNLDVYLNGVKLYNGSEVNVASGSTFTILTGNPANGTLIETVGILSNTSSGPWYIGNSTVNYTYIAVGNTTVNTTINATSVNISTNFSANATYVNAAAVNATSYNIGSSFIANATGTYVTGTVNAASHTVGTNFVANTSQITLSGIPLSANGGLGSSGQFLTSNGSSGSPYWSSIANTVTTFTATQTFNGNTSTFAEILLNAAETTNVSATAATGTVTYYLNNQSILYYTSNATANFTLNFAFSSGTSVNTALATGQTVTCVFLNTNGTTAYYANAFQVDGVSVTPKWQGGTAPSAGNASSIDLYQFSIVKTASATYTVLASLTQFK